VTGAAALATLNPIALIGFGLCAFAGAVQIYEYWRGILARHRRFNENFLQALARLVGRNRRRYGGYIIHIGVVLMAVGIIGIEMFQTETQGSLTEGEQLTLGNYAMTYQSLAEFDTPDGRNVARAVVSISKDGQPITELYPRRDYYYESQQPMTIPGVHSTSMEDLYVLLVNWEPITSQRATFKIYHNPLVNWLWTGGLVFILGTMVAAWPAKEKETLSVRAQEPAVQPAKA
jgi:cytochrome c-type biogenesis protein CcmF